MSKLVCQNCKSIAVEYEDYVGGTSYYRCETCGMRGNEDKFTQVTTFNRITADEETLAEKLVILSYIPKKIPLTDIRGRSIGYKSVLRPVWKSGVTEEIYSKKFEAIAATVNKLKEVVKDE